MADALLRLRLTFKDGLPQKEVLVRSGDFDRLSRRLHELKASTERKRTAVLDVLYEDLDPRDVDARLFFSLDSIESLDIVETEPTPPPIA